MAMSDFIAFDTETSGTNPDKDFLIEVAAVRFSSGKVQDKFVSFIDPGCAIPADATAVNGITASMVSGQPLLAEVLQRLSEFCQKDLLIAHNAVFDYKFLLAGYKKLKLAAPQGLILDTLSIAKQALPGLINYRLSGLISHFGIEVEGDFHRAELDAFCCGMLFIELLKRISGSGQRVPMQNLINLSGGERRFPKIEDDTRQLGLF